MKHTPKKQENKNTIQQGILIQQEYRGILPPPNHLEHYEHILKGSAERILKMAENQAEHRINQENKLVDDNINYKKKRTAYSFYSNVHAISISCCLYIYWKRNYWIILNYFSYDYRYN